MVRCLPGCDTSGVSILAVSGSQGARLRWFPVRPGRAARRYIARPEGPRGRESRTPYFVHKRIDPSVVPLKSCLKHRLLVLAMTSWFIGVEASVISGALLYSKVIRFWFPVGKRLVLAARRPYIEKIWFEPVPRQQKKRPASASRFSILWWAVRGSACSAGGRCGAFAPCALRWQTLTRLLSSAPRRVRTHERATKKTANRS